jgi:hypothetical protein
VPSVFVPHPIQDRTDDEMRALAERAVRGGARGGDALRRLRRIRSRRPPDAGLAGADPPPGAGHLYRAVA